MPREFRTEKDGLYLTSGRTTILTKVYIALQNQYRRMEKLAALVDEGGGGAAAELAQKWAANPEDVEVADGEFSAKHYSTKSDEYRSAASGHATTASGFAGNASDSADLAQKWAADPENVEVAAGEYSAKHHAIKALASATQAETAEISAGGHATTASGFATDAEGFKDDAETAALKALTKIKDKKIVTENYTIIAADEGKMILAGHATTKINITVPDNLFTDFTDGYPFVAVRRSGAAAVKVISDGASVVQGGTEIGTQNKTIIIDWEDASTVTVTGGTEYPFTEVPYVAVGIVIGISPGRVTLATDHFRVPEGVTSFTFDENGNPMSAVHDGTNWVFVQSQESFTDGVSTFTVNVQGGDLQIYDETEQVLTEIYN